MKRLLLPRSGKLCLIFLLLILTATTAKPSYAAVRCEAQYGGGEVCVKTGQLQIDKEVFDPEAKKFVDNLGISSHKFVPGEELLFKLKVKNVGDATFDKVQVSDTLPGHLELVSGNTSFEITGLTSGKTEEREIKSRVVKADKFPDGKSIICEVNVAEVVSGGERDKDTSQVCLQAKVLGVSVPKVLPKAGSENWIIAFGSILALTIGSYLVRLKKLARG